MFKEVPIARCMRRAFTGGVAGLAMVAIPSFAQDVQRGERVEVTGSSIKRIDAESALPVTVIKKADLDKLGVSTAAELLDRISSNNGQGYNATLALGDAARPGFSGASLRGLGSTNTLILLNGRRLAVYAFDGGGVNLSAIPLAALERVEILRDGASAIYGTDAIAGVINFITRKDYQGATIEGGYAATDSKGGNYYNGTASFGFGDLATNGFNIFGTLDYRKQTAIKASQRTYAKTAYIPTEGINRLSSNAVPANISVAQLSGLVNPYAPAFRGVAASCAPPASFGIRPTDDRCRYDYASVIDILNPTESASVFLRGTVQLNANNQLFAEYLHSENRYKFAISPVPASEATTFNGDPLLYPSTGKYYPGNGITPAIPGVVVDSGGYPGYADLYWRTLAAGPRTNVTKEKNDRLLLGAEGSGYGWDYNVGLMRTQNKVTDSYVDGWLKESVLLRTGLTPKAPGYSAAVLAAGGIDPNINPFSISQDAAGQAALAAAKVNQVVRVGKSTRDSIDGRASREVYNLPAGPLSLAVGAEFRREKYEDIPADIFSTGDLVGSGGDLQPVSADRRVSAAFAELNIPIVKNLEGGIAARFDHYSDFGNTTNPKVTLRWQPTQALLLRASAGTGFRAPTLPELFTGTTQTNSGGVYDDPLYDSSLGAGTSRCATQFNGQYCGAQLKIKQGGNSSLQPEKSYQWSAGFLLEPTRDVSVGVDYFYIKQRQQIGIINGDIKIQDYIDNFNRTTRTSSSVYSGDIITKVDPIAAATVIDYTAANYANVAEQITSGIDISARYRLPQTAYGQFTAGIEATYLTSSKNKLKGQSDYTQNIGLYATFGPVLRYKQVLSLNYDYGPFNAAVFYNWSSSYEDQNPTPAGTTRRVGAYETIDISSSYTAFRALKLTLGIRNLMDRNPPFSNQNQYFQVGYDPTIGDPHGRTYYARLSYTYK